MSNLGLGKKIWRHCPYQEKPKREGKRLRTVAVEQRGQEQCTLQYIIGEASKGLGEAIFFFSFFLFLFLVPDEDRES